MFGFGVDTHQTAQSISDLKNPFTNDKMVGFSTYCSISFGEWHYRGSIKYENGNTKGEQNFEGENFSALLKKMEMFMNEMENQK